MEFITDYSQEYEELQELNSFILTNLPKKKDCEYKSDISHYVDYFQNNEIINFNVYETRTYKCNLVMPRELDYRSDTIKKFVINNLHIGIANQILDGDLKRNYIEINGVKYYPKNEGD